MVIPWGTPIACTVATPLTPLGQPPLNHPIYPIPSGAGLQHHLLAGLHPPNPILPPGATIQV